MSSKRTKSGGSQFSKDAFTDSFKRQGGEVVNQAESAISSGAWIYPIRGIFYLVSRPKLLQPLLPTLGTALLVSVGVLVAMFFLTYLPQVAVLAFVSGPLAFLGAIPLVLGESYVILMFLSKTFLFKSAEADLFDAVLLGRNHTELVKQGRLINGGRSGSKSKATQLGKAITRPLTQGRWWMSTDGIVRYVLSLPLNLIPVVGTVFFLGYNGMRAGPSSHARYFQLKGFDKQKRAEFIQRRRGAYTAFGTVAMALNLVPVASMFFQLTTAVGAALWASDIENKSSSGKQASSSSTSQGSGAGSAEQEVELPPSYSAAAAGGGGNKDAGKKEL